MTHNHFYITGLLCTALLATGCVASKIDQGSGSSTSSVSTVSHGGPVQDLVTLIDHLRADSHTVTPGEPLSQPFFSVKGQATTVDTETIQIYEYADAQSMEADASKVSHDGGSVGTSMMSWVGPPHFFKKGRILVLYIGQEKTLLQELTSLLGSQFAGR